MSNTTTGIPRTMLVTLALVACGDRDTQGSASVDGATELIDAALLDAEEGLTSAASLVHWQVNIEWVVSDMGEDEFALRAADKHRLPDIIAAQELWPKPVCGIGNAKGQDALSSPQECLSENYGPTSFMAILNQKTGREFALRYMAKSANAVLWAKDRFVHEDSMMWSFGGTQGLRDACCAGASTEAGCLQSRNIGLAVLLKDNRNTIGEADDKRIAVASVHTGGWSGGCVLAHLDQAERAFDSWQIEHPDQALSRRFISGDLNKRPDTSSSTAIAQKQERSPGCWWKGFAAGHSCGGRTGEYLDTIWEKHWDADTSNNASICGQWTFPINSENKKCDVTEDSAGQRYQRIDYTFVKGDALDAQRLRSHVDKGYHDNNGNDRFDFGEAYSNSHRGIYTEVDY